MPDRIIRVGILTSDAVNKLSWQAEVFYRRLMSVVDDFGRYDGRPSVLRAALFPLRIANVSEPDVAKWLDECSTAALVRGYVVANQQYVEILKFGQRMRAKRSKFPHPDSPGGGHVLSNDNICLHPSEYDSASDLFKGESLRGDETPRGTFVKPTLAEATALAVEKGMPAIEGEKFWHNHEAAGWIIKGKPMKSVNSAMATWKLNYDSGRFSAPMGIPAGGGPNGKPKLYELRMISEAKQKQADDLKHRHCSPVATGDVWDDEPARQRFIALRRSIKEINAQIANHTT